MDTGTCYKVTEYPKIAFRKDKMLKGEGLAVLEEKKNKNEIYQLQ